jgi:hypothetical protein
MLNEATKNLSRQDAKAQRKAFSYFPELGELCAFARVILSRFDRLLICIK